jgi:hypothetical protein
VAIAKARQEAVSFAGCVDSRRLTLRESTYFINTAVEYSRCSENLSLQANYNFPNCSCVLEPSTVHVDARGLKEWRRLTKKANDCLIMKSFIITLIEKSI